MGVNKRISILAFIYMVLFTIMSALISCGSSSGTDSDGQGVGSIVFSIQIPGTTGDPFSQYKASSLDCEALGITSVEAEVSDEYGNLIAHGGPWDCNIGEGIIYGVKAGHNRTVLVFLRDTDLCVKYQGDSPEIVVIAGQTTDAGTIELAQPEEIENNPPVAMADSMHVVFSGMVSVLDSGQESLLYNDTDPDNDSLTVNTTPLVYPEHGKLSLNTDGTFTYVHDGSTAQIDTFTYEVSDTYGATATAAVTIDITSSQDTNTPPALTNAAVSPETGKTSTIFTFSVLYTDAQMDAPEAKLVFIGDVSHEMTLSTGEAYNGTYVYSTTLPGGTRPFYFLFDDGKNGPTIFPPSGQPPIAGPVVTGPANHIPAAANDSMTVAMGGTVTVLDSGIGSLLANDSDPDGDDLSVSPAPLSGPDHGILILNTDGTFSYTHDGSTTDQDSFVYEISDSHGNTANGSVAITITSLPPNTSPVLSDGTVGPGTGDESTMFSFSVVYYDADGDAPASRIVFIDSNPHLMALSTGDPHNGTYTFETTLAEGTHSFSFSFEDINGSPDVLPDTGAFTGPVVTGPANQDPVAADDSITVAMGGTATVLDSGIGSLLANDSDPDGDSLSVNPAPLSGPDHGILILNTDGTFSYTHDGSTTDQDSFIYEISDTHGNTADASVTITITSLPPNTAPMLSIGTASPETGDESTLFTFSVVYYDADGDEPASRIVFIDSNPNEMTLSDGETHNGTYTFETELAEGTHSFSFSFEDINGGSDVLPDTGTFTGPVVTGPVNQDPVALDDIMTVNSSGAVSVLNSGYDSLLANDTDPDGDDLSIDLASVEGPVHGTLVLNPDGTFIYTHDGSASDEDGFAYTIEDGNGGSSTGHVTILIVQPSEHDPVLKTPDIYPVNGNTSEVFTYSVHYFDADSDAPQLKYVYIDGIPFSMTLIDGNDFDGDYVYQTTLDTGDHEYSFFFTDGHGGIAVLPVSGNYSGPVVTDITGDLYVAPFPIGDDANNGSTLEPFATIAHAIDIAGGTPDAPITINIAAGLYYENIDLDAWERLKGGWNTDFSERWDFSTNGVHAADGYKTIIDGDKVARCITIESVEGAEIDGLTIRNGTAPIVTGRGGGIYMSLCSPAITYCRIISNNTSSQDSSGGAGIYCEYGSPVISKCIISENSVSGKRDRCCGCISNSYGGGMSNYNASPVITDTIFSNNSIVSAAVSGGAIYNLYSSPTIDRCVFQENSADGSRSYGGAIYNENGSPVITNCLFVGNSATGSDYSKGGAICNSSGEPIITNCTFTLNSATYKAGGLYNASCTVPVITNCIFWDNDALHSKEIYNPSSCTVTYCNIDQCPYDNDPDNFNIRLDPMFSNPADGDFHLQSLSPCIDTGSNDAPMLPGVDIEGAPRIINNTVDMGAFEWF